MEKKITILGRIGDTEFQNNDCCKVLHRKGISKCIKTVTNYPPIVIRKPKRLIKRNEPKILRFVRNQYGKRIRKEYESGMIKTSWMSMKMLEPRNDGCSNSITTIQKDNMYVTRIYRS